MQKPYIIGIAGGTASGKTTLANRIKDELNTNAIIISHDCYYKSLTNLTKAEREQKNYDCPEAYETDFMIRQIKELIDGKEVQRPIYSYTERLREEKTVTLHPTPIIIIEGILVLENDELSNLMNLKIFVDTDADIRLTRLIERDRAERGLSLEYIISKYKDTLKPMHEKYVEPTKKKADIIVSGKSETNLNILSKLLEFLSNMC